MSVRDDYPAVAILHDAWTSRDRRGVTPPQAVQMLDEIESLRRWKAEASATLDEWEGVWMIAGQPRGPGLPSISKAQGVAREIQRLRSYCDAWKNGVADIVEQFGYDRRAASGPADLLPGLTTLVDQRNDLWERVCELETRLERHPVTTGGAGMLDPGPLNGWCDCCDCEYPSVEVYPTEDDDVVTLCSSCVDELRSMVAGTEMADAFDSETEPLDEGSAP